MNSGERQTTPGGRAGTLLVCLGPGPGPGQHLGLRTPSKGIMGVHGWTNHGHGSYSGAQGAMVKTPEGTSPSVPTVRPGQAARSGPHAWHPAAVTCGGPQRNCPGPQGADSKVHGDGETLGRAPAPASCLCPPCRGHRTEGRAEPLQHGGRGPGLRRHTGGSPRLLLALVSRLFSRRFRRRALRLLISST